MLSSNAPVVPTRCSVHFASWPMVAVSWWSVTNPSRWPSTSGRSALDELEIIGTQAHVFAEDFPAAADLIAADPGAWAAIAPTVYPLDQVVEVGLIPMAKGEAPQIKVLFDPSADAPRPLRTET